MLLCSDEGVEHYGCLSISNSFQVNIHPGHREPGVYFSDIVILPVYSRLEVNQQADEIRNLQAFFPVSLLYLVGILAIGHCARNFCHRVFRYIILKGAN